MKNFKNYKKYSLLHIGDWIDTYVSYKLPEEIQKICIEKGNQRRTK